MKELKLSDRLYLCTCGNWMDRDLNAASNIREEARRMLLAG
nr:zinc ribbon domain-containing protein [Eubacterium ramulus]